MFLVNIDSLSKENLIDQSKVYILSSVSDEGKSLLEEEYEGYIKNMLRHRNSTIVEDIKEADILISYDYLFDVSEQVDLTSYAIPTYTPGQTYSVSSYGSYSSTLSSSGSWGSTTGVKTVRSKKSKRALRIFVFKQDGQRISEIYITSEGSNTNKREVFPVLLASGSEFLGRHYPKTITVSQPVKSEKVSFIKGESYIINHKKINKNAEYCSPIKKIFFLCR